MSRGYKDALKAHDEIWHALRTELKNIILQEETAFRNDLLNEVDHYLQEEAINESKVKSDVLDEVKRQISVNESNHMDTQPDDPDKISQEIKIFLVELIHPKKYSAGNISHNLLYFCIIIHFHRDRSLLHVLPTTRYVLFGGSLVVQKSHIYKQIMTVFFTSRLPKSILKEKNVHDFEKSEFNCESPMLHYFVLAAVKKV